MFNQSSAVSQSLIRLSIGLLMVFMIHFSAGVRESPTTLPSNSGVVNVKAAQVANLSEGYQPINGINPSNPLDAASLHLDGPDLYVNKLSAWNEAWQIEYTIQFGNDGGLTETAEIIDYLPADTSWTGEWDITGIALNRVGLVWSSEQIIWTINDLAPGEAGEISFLVNVDSPGEPLIWYTNIVEIEPLEGDLNPDDNSCEVELFSGGEVREVHHWLNPWGSSAMWGTAVPGLTVTVTTPGGEYFAVANPGCGGCWNIDDVGVLEPGDALQVAAGAGVIPVEITIPDPFNAAVDTTLYTVAGEIGGWVEQPVEILGDWPDGTKMVATDASGNFSGSFVEIPRGARGKVVIDEMVSSALVVFLRPFQALDLVLEVNYAYDWVIGSYEPGHTIGIDVTDKHGALIGEATVESKIQPEWEGQSGFSTVTDGWVSSQPDIQPGYWVYGLADNGFASDLRVGKITASIDYDIDQVNGNVNAAWIEEDVFAVCEVWEEGGPKIEFTVNPNNGSFNCDFQSAAWDLQPEQIVAITYFEPDNDRVTNIFTGYKTYLPLTLRIED